VAKQTDFGNNVEGLRAAIRRLPKTSKKELGKASKAIAGDVAMDARTKAASQAGRVGGWALLGPTIRAGGSSIPEVKIGGKRKIKGRSRISGGRQTVGDLLWGLEFGGRARPRTMQFLPHLGQTGYALWPTVRARSEQTGQDYSKALLRALEAI